MEASEYANIAQLEDRHWWYVGMRQIAATLVRDLPLPHAAQILDAGCGVGGGLHWLSAFGSTTGIDFHPLAVRYSVRQSPRVARASIQELPFPTHTFDLVTSFEVLYHLAVTNDIRAFHELARVTRPGGWLMVRVPAHDWLRGAHDRQVHTRHRYEAHELRTKIQAAGLQLVKLTSVGITFWPLAVVSRLIERTHAPHSDVTLPAPPLNQILQTLLSAERFWLRRFNLPLGLSLLAIARKPQHS